MPEPIPPGRAGRMWLRLRLDSAKRSRDLLDRKRQLLRFEHERAGRLREESARRWRSACVEADRWGERAAILGGSTSLSQSAVSVAGRARIQVRWQNTMGVLHPGEPDISAPVLGGAEVAAGNSAVGPAAAAYRDALRAAVEHATADASYRAIDTELRSTQRRLRAIERHRIPELEQALGRLELRLDELERDERVVTRWAVDRRRGPNGASGRSAGPVHAQ